MSGRAGVSSSELAMLTARRDGLPAVKVRRATTRKERDIQRAILDYLKTVPGVVAWRNNVGAVKDGDRFIRFGFKGLSDIVGWQVVHLGRVRDVGTNHSNSRLARFLAIEVKKPDEYPTVEQRAFLEMVTRAGGLAIVARSVQDVHEALK